MRTPRVLEPVIIAGILTGLLVQSAVRAEEWQPGRLEGAVSAGVFDTAADSPSGELGLEVRRATRLANLAILGGVSGNDDGGLWAYAGARYDLSLATRWTLAPGFAVTYYDRGEGKDLGLDLEFRSSIEIARRLSDRLRVGFVFYHLSNASISEDNPGANSAVLSLAFRQRLAHGS